MRVFLVGKIKCRSKSVYILSALFAFLLVLGHSYNQAGSWDLIFGGGRDTLLSFAAFVLLFIVFSLCLSKLFVFLDSYRVPLPQKSAGGFKGIFESRTFLVSIIIILLCWLPYIIAFYPAILSPDPSFQIMQFFGIDTKYSGYAVMINEAVLITDHHPFLHTVLLGGLTKLGEALGSVNLGLFFYSTLQIAILSSTLAMSICYLGKLKTPYRYRMVVLFVYALLPIFPFYAMSSVKDVIFSAFILVYVILIHSLMMDKKTLGAKKIIAFIAVMLLIQMLRHNGIMIIILTLPLLIVVGKRVRARLALVFICALGLYFGYQNILLPTLEITPGSIREVFSVPFQQTARYVSEHADELSDEDIAIIDNILGYDDLAKRYNPELADPVKNNFNKYATTEDLMDYFGVWFDGLMRHPDTYIQATVHNTYGYLCPNKISWTIYFKYDDRLENKGIDYSYNNLDGMRSVLSIVAIALPYLPFAGLIVSIGFYVWLILIMICYLIYRKKGGHIIYLLPYIAVILTCFISPANTYFRYVLPLMMQMPFIIGLFIHSLRDMNGISAIAIDVKSAED